MKITIVIPLAKHLEIDYNELNLPKNTNLKVVKGSNPSENRNIGIANSITPLIAFINGHTILTDNWKEQVDKFFKEHPEIDIVGGPQHNWKGDNAFAQATGIAMSSKFGAGAVSSRYSGKELILDADETYLTSANLICRKRVFKKVKFDETLYPGEDPKFISDAKKAGFKVAYCPDIIVYNKKRGNPVALAKQIFNYGKTRPKKEPLIETFKHPSFLVPPIFVLYLICLPFFFLFMPMLTVFIWIYLALVAISSLSGKGLILIILLLFIFPLIHISYGLGFIYGALTK